MNACSAHNHNHTTLTLTNNAGARIKAIEKCYVLVITAQQTQQYQQYQQHDTQYLMSTTLVCQLSIHPSSQANHIKPACLQYLSVYMYSAPNTRATMDMRASERARNRIDRRIFGPLWQLPKVFFRAFLQAHHLATTRLCCRQLGRLVIFMFFLSFASSSRAHTQPYVHYTRAHTTHTHTHT